MRGLKLRFLRTSAKTQFAPHTGAWIETEYSDNYYIAAYFAPHTGAWIETTFVAACGTSTRFAPHTGAWIETQRTKIEADSVLSHPTRVRGLKLLLLLNAVR